MTISTNLLALVFVLSFLIVFHEGGHFAVAKVFRFPVEVFSLGFGKRLFGVKRKETDYRVSLIPLGGYVKVVGLGPDESDVVSGTSQAAPAQPGTRLQRLLILFAGPGVNLALAFLLTALAFAIGVEVAVYKSEAPVVKVVDRGSPAEKAGIREGDRLETISGKTVKTWEDVEIETGLAPREKLAVGILRDGRPLTLELTPEPRTKYDIGYTGLNPAILAVVARVVPNYPGAKAGLKVGDQIVSVNGKPVVLYFEVVRYIREAAAGFDRNGAGPIALVVRRGGETITLNVVPVKEGESWRIGFAPRQETTIRRLGLGAAFAASWRENLRQVQVTGQIVGRLFRGTGSMRQLSGPIDIAKFSGEAARSGVAPLVMLMGVLSLQLGLLNLLPIPLLDGGQIFVTLLEAAARRDFSLKVKERLLQAGFVFLVLVMVTVLYFDVLKNVSF
ncbi:MAG: RIP metalloprotease RseP [Thermoanaerobaculia bacterium]|jgi:regulator of sigma E protease